MNRRVCVGYVQTLCHFIYGTWASSDCSFPKSSGTNPPQILREASILFLLLLSYGTIAHVSINYLAFIFNFNLHVTDSQSGQSCNSVYWVQVWRFCETGLRKIYIHEWLKNFFLENLSQVEKEKEHGSQRWVWVLAWNELKP